MTGEFDLIARYFLPLTQNRTEARGLRDDAAVFVIPADQELVVSTDTLTAGIHFPVDAPPQDIAHKALRVNLSDLAAMGARPLSYQLALSLPHAPDAPWMESFTGALRDDQQAFGIFCSGGDTTRTHGGLSVTITILGLAPQGRAVGRSGAQPDDIMILTGPIGDAWIGLQILQGRLQVDQASQFLEAYYRPVPRIAIADIVRDHAHAAIDISDGLVADLGHISDASGCGADLRMSRDLFGAQANALLEVGLVKPVDLLAGGDDYELVLAVASDRADACIAHLRGRGLCPVKLGTFLNGSGVHVHDPSGKVIHLSHAGYEHFRQ